MLGLKKFADSHMHLEINDFAKARELLDHSASLGVTDVNLLCCENYPGFSRADMFTSLYFKTHYDKMNVRVFGSLCELDIYKDVPFEDQLRRIMKLGCDGIKFMNMKPDLHKLLGRGLNDPVYEPMFALLEETGFPIVIHAADPEEFWGEPEGMLEGAVAAGWWYGDGSFPTYQQIYDELYEVFDRHPKLNVVMAHFFFLSNNLKEAIRIMEKYPNLRLDLTPGHEMYMGFSKDIPAWREFFKKYEDRILFGTDATTTRTLAIQRMKYDLVAQALTYDENEFPIPRNPDIFVRGLHLDRSTVEKICYDNFYALVGEARPVDMDFVRAEAQKMIADVKKYAELDGTRALLEEFLQKTE